MQSRRLFLITYILLAITCVCIAVFFLIFLKNCNPISILSLFLLFFNYLFMTLTLWKIRKDPPDRYTKRFQKASTRNGIITLLVLFFCLMSVLFIPYMHTKACKNRVYPEFQKKEEEIHSANVRISGYTVEEDGDDSETAWDLVSGSAVVFEKRGFTYFALTAKHVVSHDNYLYKIQTNDIPSLKDARNKDWHGLTSYYDSYPDCRICYVSPKYDLAVVSFRTKENITPVSLAEKNVSKGDKVMAVASMDTEMFLRTYGRIMSNHPKHLTTDDGLVSESYFHDAYIEAGFSGGGLFNSNMELVGINVAGQHDNLGHYYFSAMLPLNQIKKCLKEWRKEDALINPEFR